jgi:tRNA (guanine37-N1)-methyltransferase
LRKRQQEKPSRVFSSENSGKVPNSYDVVGSIAIIRVLSASPGQAQGFAEAIMHTHKSVKTVLVQVSPVDGDFRLRRLRHVAGGNVTRTVHRESGCLFSVDVANCYFSPRLSYERLRVARLVKSSETVVNMFAGVGCFSILIAKQANPVKVFSIDVNPVAIEFMQENIRLNRVYGTVVPLLGDSKAVISSRLQGVADRVLMPLPEKALEYLPAAVSALKPSGGWIHVHVFEHAAKTESPIEKVKLKLTEALASLSIDFEVPLIRVVRSTGPNWFQIVADVYLPALTQCLRL